MKKILLIIAFTIAGFITVVAERTTENSSNKTPIFTKNSLIASVEDIKWVKFSDFNHIYVSMYQTCPTVEIEFSNFTPLDMLGIVEYSLAFFYLFHEDTLLFNPGLRLHQRAHSYIFVDLVLYFDYFDTNKFYFLGSFPDCSDNWGHSMTEEKREQYRKQSEEMSILRGEQYKVFLQYMRDTGKLIEDNTSVEPVSPQEPNDISIYPNPTTGELRIRNYELGIRNYETTLGVSQLGIEGVEIYDIVGKKQSTVNCQLSTVNSIDISHLPAGIYFVRITTEKGVFSKKVVKR